MVPFDGYSCVKAVLVMTQGERPPRPKYPYVTGGLWKLIKRCWDQRPSSRPKTSEVVEILLNSSVSHLFWRLPACMLDNARHI